MTWTRDREQSLLLWTRQIVSMSYMFIQAARWTRRMLLTMNFVTVLGLVYTIPSNACGIVAGVVCVAWQWSAIIVAFISSIASGMALAYDLPSRLRMFERSGSTLLKLSRRISLELHKQPDERNNDVDFAEGVIREFDEIIENSQLPWFIKGEDQLANISLLRSYTVTSSTHSSQNTDTVSSDDASEASNDGVAGSVKDIEGQIRTTPHDIAAMKHFHEIVKRLDGVDIHKE